jgi:hypothetical protein
MLALVALQQVRRFPELHQAHRRCPRTPNSHSKTIRPTHHHALRAWGRGDPTGPNSVCISAHWRLWMREKSGCVELVVHRCSSASVGVGVKCGVNWGAGSVANGSAYGIHSPVFTPGHDHPLYGLKSGLGWAHRSAQYARDCPRWCHGWCHALRFGEARSRASALA